MRALTVSELIGNISATLKNDPDLGLVYLRGEITGFKAYYPSGHLYFAVKDSRSRIKAVMYRTYASALKFELRDGMDAIFTGRVDIYDKSGDIQFYVVDAVPDGIGAAFLAVEQLKERLAAEGIFAPEHKKRLPAFPAKTGVVTSLSGAAVHDIINVISRRYPITKVKVYGCTVQGDGAPASIVSALKRADEDGCDVIICGRGGGSAEDLIVFSDERIVRTVYSMKTPVISAVGHEIDTPLTDLAADMRAPTPSAAAELAVPDIEALLADLDSRKTALDGALSGLLSAKQAQAAERMSRLRAVYPAVRIDRLGQIALSLRYALDREMSRIIAAKENALASAAASLDALSPLKTMSRGYSLVCKEERLVRSAGELTAGDTVRLVFADGERNAQITGG